MKILFLAANPQSTGRLNLSKEAREIEEGLKRSKLAHEFEFVQRWEVRPQDLRRALLEENPDIVHFSGHGREQGLVLVDNAGQAKPATSEALAGLFILFPSIKCVLLNACYAEVQAKAIVQHIDYVIGIKDTIKDDAAIAFTTGFYDGLGYGRNIEDAFELGRNAIVWELASFSNTTREMIPVDFVKAKTSESLPEHLKPILLKKDANVAQNVKNKSIKPDYLVKNQNPIQTYRERVKEYLADRILTPIEKFQLATLTKELGISESEANHILQAELQEIEQAKENFQKVLRQTIREIERGDYPYSKKIEQQFKDLQSNLKLTDSEVEEISDVVLKQLEQAEAETKSEVTESKPTIEEKSQPASPPSLQEFEFEVVTVKVQKSRQVQRSGLFGLKEEVKIVSNIKLSLNHGLAEYFTEDLDNGVTLDMVDIPGGKFMMGSPEGEGAAREKPQHQVTVLPFFMGKYPITQAQWRAIASREDLKVERDLNPDPSYFGDELCPVEQVSWYDAVEFCGRLSKHTGKEYRLPSEAEWEYACRADTITPFHFGETITTDLANYAKYQKTTPVGGFPANAFGLSD